MLVDRTPENGGSVRFATFEELRDSYAAGKLHPADLKNAVAQQLIDLLEPVRKRFGQPDLRDMWDELEALLKV
jgi:tyrosyl-tRNA synthetase